MRSIAAALVTLATCFAVANEAEVIVFVAAQPARTIALPDMLGATVMPTMDVKSDWANYDLAGIYNDMRAGAIRFPGGTIGDNYLWDQNRLQRWEGYPTESTPGKISDPNWLDHPTLVANLRRMTNVHTLAVVANFDGAFRVGDKGWVATAAEATTGIETMADLARSWAQALRRELGDDYTFVWELGSETYFGLGTDFHQPLAPAEYGKALRVFYRRIKEGDPRSVVAAAGPLDKNGKSRTGKAFLYTWDGKYADHSAQEWWDAAIREVGDSFDQATFHNYKSKRIVGKVVDFSKPIGYVDMVRRAVDFIQGRVPNKKLSFSFTEYNGSDNDTTGPSLTGLEHCLDMSEQMGDFYKGGCDLLLYWTFRTAGYKHPVVSKTPKNGALVKHPPYYMMRLWAQYMRPVVLSDSSTDADAIYAFATADAAPMNGGAPGEYGVFLINRTTADKTVEVKLPAEASLASARGETMYEDGKNEDPITRGKATPVDNDVAIVPAAVIAQTGASATVRLPGRSLTALSFGR